jgi:hypothetical protein
LRAGPDMMILEYFRPKIRGKWPFLVQNTASFLQNLNQNIGFTEKRHFFTKKIGKNRRKL